MKKTNVPFEKCPYCKTGNIKRYPKNYNEHVGGMLYCDDQCCMLSDAYCDIWEEYTQENLDRLGELVAKMDWHTEIGVSCLWVNIRKVDNSVLNAWHYYYEEYTGGSGSLRGDDGLNHLSGISGAGYLQSPFKWQCAEAIERGSLPQRTGQPIHPSQRIK